MDHEQLRAFIDRSWDQSVVPALHEYICIPNKSPYFDPDWEQAGHMARAVELAAGYCRRHGPAGLIVEVLQLPGRTPLLLLELGGSAPGDVLLYGHLDKQPELADWREGLAPFSPVLEGDKLYGRGGADDGYAVFAIVTALRALAETRTPHARCVALIECCEESGSYDLPAYVEHLASRIGDVSLVVCLDSGCGDYERLWNTTSLRGLVTGNLVVEVLREGVHSGDASGIVASSFRIARSLLSRLEDEATGKITLRPLHATIPKARIAEAKATARVLGRRLLSSQPFVAGMKPMHANPEELLLNRTWRPALSITGAAGLPALGDAGNVLRPSTSLKLSLRIPPTCDPQEATRLVQTLLEKSPPYGAHVRFEAEKGSPGWNAPTLPPWLERSLHRASLATFGQRACAIGEGGSIPFMGMLGVRYPKASFLITGVLGPASNAHGPNEFLHIPTGKRVTACVAHVLADHAQHTTQDQAMSALRASAQKPARAKRAASSKSKARRS